MVALLKEFLIGATAAIFLAGCATLPDTVLRSEPIGDWRTEIIVPTPKVKHEMKVVRGWTGWV
jgi:starvation-inducible outer membrane lipoprotein